MIKQETYDRLPKIVKDYIQALERELKVTQQLLKDIVDGQAPSEFYMDQYVGGEFKKIYIQGSHLGCVTGDLKVTFNVTPEHALRIFFEGHNQKEAVIAPRAANSIEVVAVQRFR